MTELLSDIDTPSDAELISRVRGGDVAAYGELFARHKLAATRLARQLVRGPDADDLVSDAFAKVLTVLQGGGGPDVAFRAYLLTAVRRLHVDRVRAGSRLQTSDDMTQFDPGIPFQDTAVSGFESGAAAKAFASLPERWQLVLWHLEVEGQKPADIAPLLGMSANSVSALAYRAREGLRQAFLTMHLSDISAEQCRWVNEHLGAYVRNGLAKRDAAKVDAHLKECRRCTAMYLELTEVNSDLKAIIAPLLLGAAAAGYLTSTGSAGTAGALAVLGRLRDAVLANASVAATGAAAAGVAAVATTVVLVTHHGAATTVTSADRPIAATTQIGTPGASSDVSANAGPGVGSPVASSQPSSPVGSLALSPASPVGAPGSWTTPGALPSTVGNPVAPGGAPGTGPGSGLGTSTAPSTPAAPSAPASTPAGTPSTPQSPHSPSHPSTTPAPPQHSTPPPTHQPTPAEPGPSTPAPSTPAPTTPVPTTPVPSAGGTNGGSPGGDTGNGNPGGNPSGGTSGDTTGGDPTGGGTGQTTPPPPDTGGGSGGNTGGSTLPAIESLSPVFAFDSDAQALTFTVAHLNSPTSTVGISMTSGGEFTKLPKECGFADDSAAGAGTQVTCIPALSAMSAGMSAVQADVTTGGYSVALPVTLDAGATHLGGTLNVDGYQGTYSWVATLPAPTVDLAMNGLTPGTATSDVHGVADFTGSVSGLTDGLPVTFTVSADDPSDSSTAGSPNQASFALPETLPTSSKCSPVNGAPNQLTCTGLTDNEAVDLPVKLVDADGKPVTGTVYVTVAPVGASDPDLSNNIASAAVRLEALTATTGVAKITGANVSVQLNVTDIPAGSKGLYIDLPDTPSNADTGLVGGEGCASTGTNRIFCPLADGTTTISVELQLKQPPGRDKDGIDVELNVSSIGYDVPTAVHASIHLDPSKP